MEETKELTKRCHGLSYKALPEEVIDRVKYHTLDYMGVAARGSLSESSPPILNFVSNRGMVGEGAWVAHFFLFFIAVISKYSPPTSLVAAVASRISGASFMKTMMVTLQISVPFFFLTFAIFNWDILLLKPGLLQLAALGVLMVGCLTAAVAIHGRLFKRKIYDLSSRFLVILLALFILFYPKGILSAFALIPAVVMIVLLTLRTEKASASS